MWGVAEGGLAKEERRMGRWRSEGEVEDMRERRVLRGGGVMCPIREGWGLMMTGMVVICFRCRYWVRRMCRCECWLGWDGK